MHIETSAINREVLRGRGRRLETWTLAACAVEAAVGLLAGGAARSAALLGFGLQSLVEVVSGALVLWRLSPAGSGVRVAITEKHTVRAIGVTLLLVAAYIGWDAARALLRHEPPAASPAGLVLAVASLVAMPLLARAKRRVAAGLHSAALRADAVHTDVCTWQAAIMLAGLGLNAGMGWWWADPVAALVMVPLIVLEGLRALRGETCGCVECYD